MTKKRKRVIGRNVVSPISSDTVRHVANIARLNLSERETRKFQKELSDVLQAFKELDKVKTDAQPSFQPMEIKDVVREDRVEDCFPQEKALENTAHKEKGFFKGPKVV